MRKLLRLFAITCVSMGAMVGSAAAASISDTGPGSTNIVKNETSNNVDIKCDNKVNVTSNNNQSGSSGAATVENNTNAGSATSGSVNQSNDVHTSVDASCGGTTAAGGQGGAGGGVPSTPAAAPASAPAGGQGGAGGLVLGSSTQVQSLPNTGTNPMVVTGIIAAGLSGVAALTRVGVMAYGASKVRL
jgi:hypothetical protein